MEGRCSCEYCQLGIKLADRHLYPNIHYYGDNYDPVMHRRAMLHRGVVELRRLATVRDEADRLVGCALSAAAWAGAFYIRATIGPRRQRPPLIITDD